MSADAQPVLELRSVSKSFSSQRAVDGVSLRIQTGELFSLLGPSGCGKTTTLRMIAGFETPDSGEILLRNEPIGHLPPNERRVNTVFQSYALFPHMSARRNIEFGLKHSKTPAGDIQAKVAGVLELVQMTAKADRKPAQLSGGEKQRIALARSLVLSPEVLLLDEPLSALDPSLRKQVRSELKLLQRRTGITFVMVTHDQEEALSMSDRIALMNQGRIEQCGPPRELYERPVSRFAANFLGAMNWLTNRGIRPEHVRLSRESSPRSHAAVVQATTFYGNSIHVEAWLSSGERFTCEQPSSAQTYAPGETVHLAWNEEHEREFPAS